MSRRVRLTVVLAGAGVCAYVGAAVGAFVLVSWLLSDPDRDDVGL